MSETASETPSTQHPADKRSSTAKLYALLFLSGFILRFGFVLWKKTYVGTPPGNLPFGVEVCSIAAHIARGEGFSSPFYQDTGPTAWIAPLYPYFVSFVFRLFGIYSATSAIVILGIQCLLAAATSINICALGRRTFEGRIGFYAAWIWALSPIFFRWAVSWIWDFAASAFLLSAVFIVTLDVARHNSRNLWLALGVLWAIIALTNPALLSLMPFTFLYALYLNHRAGRRWMASLALAGVVATRRRPGSGIGMG